MMVLEIVLVVMQTLGVWEVFKHHAQNVRHAVHVMRRMGSALHARVLMHLRVDSVSLAEQDNITVQQITVAIHVQQTHGVLVESQHHALHVHHALLAIQQQEIAPLAVVLELILRRIKSAHLVHQITGTQEDHKRNVFHVIHAVHAMQTQESA